MNKNITLIFNSIFNVIYKMLNVLFPLITTAYVSRVLGAAGMGKISSVQNITQYFVMLSCLGIPTYGIREIAKCNRDAIARRKIFSELFLINTVSTFLCIVVYYGMIFFIKIENENKILFLISGISIILNFFNVEWFYQGIEKYKFIAVRNFAVKILLLILITLFVKSKDDIIIYLLLLVAGTGGNNILNVLYLKRNNIKLEFKHLAIGKHIKKVFILLCITISVELYTMIDTTMLTILCKSNIVGYYSNSIKMLRMIVTVLTGVSGVLLPRISMYISEGNISESAKLINKVLGIICFISLPCAFGVQMCAKEIVLILFGKSFINAIFTVKILSMLIIIITLSNLFASQVLMTFGYENKIMIATIIGACINIIFNLILIPKYYHNGAAIASVIGELTVAIISFHISKKFVKYNVNYSDLIKEVISIVCMCVVVFIIKYFGGVSVITLFLEIFLGAFCYLAINLIMRNTTLLKIFNILKGRRKK